MRIILMLAIGICAMGQLTSASQNAAYDRVISAIAARNFDEAQQMINDLRSKNSKLPNKEQAVQNKRVKSVQAKLDRAKKAPAKTRPQPGAAKPVRIQPQPQPQVQVQFPEMETRFEAPMREQEPIFEPVRSELSVLLDAIDNNIAQAREFYNQQSQQQFRQALDRAHKGITQFDQQSQGVRLTTEVMRRRESMVKEINELIALEERRISEARVKPEEPRASKPSVEVPTQALTALMNLIKEEIEDAQKNVSTIEGERDYEDLIKQVNDIDQKIVQAERECTDIVRAHPETRAMIRDYVNILADYTSRLDTLKEELPKVKKMLEEVESASSPALQGPEIAHKPGKAGVQPESTPGLTSGKSEKDLLSLEELFPESSKPLVEAESRVLVPESEPSSVTEPASKSSVSEKEELTGSGQGLSIGLPEQQVSQPTREVVGEAARLGGVAVPEPAVIPAEEASSQPSAASELQEPRSSEVIQEVTTAPFVEQFEHNLNIAQTTLRDLRSQFGHVETVNVEFYDDFAKANQLLRNFLTEQCRTVEMSSHVKKKSC
jgi:hypothetical protein